MRSSKSNQPVRRFIRSSWRIFFGVLLCSFTLAYVAWGATYNFYFNNTEQGDNSTATPSVTVGDDGKVIKKPGTAEPAIPPAPEDGKVPPPASVSSVVPAEVKEEHDPRWRFSAGMSGERVYGGDSGYIVGSSLEPSASISFFFNRDIGLTLFGSMLPTADYYGASSSDSHWMLGLEAEFVPIHISIGRIQNFLEIGLLGGVTAEYYRQTINDMSTYSYSNGAPVFSGGSETTGDQWSFRPEAGLRLSLNLGRTWSIIGAVRANDTFAVGEAALAFRL